MNSYYEDDIEKLDDNIRHKVVMGEMVHVSLGGMRQAQVRVMARGPDGIVGRDSDGIDYKIAWHHVYGGVEAKKPEQMAKAITTAKEPSRFSEFGGLVADLIQQDANRLTKAMDTPGLTALEVSQMEAQRNRLNAKADNVRAGK